MTICSPSTRTKRICSSKGLDDLKIAHTDPQGAYYVLLDISEFGYESDLEFCEDLAHYVGVGAVPGSSFFREPVNHLIRLHFAKKDETLLEALNRLEGLRDEDQAEKPINRRTSHHGRKESGGGGAATIIVSIRREFHQHPELSMQEFRTAQRIEEELDRLGIPHTRVGETGVLGTLKRRKGRRKSCWFCVRISTRCPLRRRTSASYRSENAGVMHACGHDAHAACLLGAAKILVGAPRRVQRKGPSGVSAGRGDRAGRKAVRRGRRAGRRRARVRPAHRVRFGGQARSASSRVMNNAAVDHFRIRGAR